MAWQVQLTILQHGLNNVQDYRLSTSDVISSAMPSLDCVSNAQKRMRCHADRSDDGRGAPTIRLRFPHQNSDQNAGLQHYYVASRENKCVVCGDTSHYLR